MDLLRALHDRSRRPLLMGILNVTPDSFSDGGKFAADERAVAHALRMAQEGADIIDVGGESTRPGAQPVDPDVQIRRVVPVISALRAALPVNVALSIDTRSATVAAQAIAAGASLINDVSAASDPAMLTVAAHHGIPIVLMHMQGTPESMQNDPRYHDVVAEVLEYLLARAQTAEAAGVAHDSIILDPGIGFGKTRLHNLELLRKLSTFAAGDYPVMLGTSRKRFMGAICRETEFAELVGATCATTTLGTVFGVRIFRVHDVRENRQAVDLTWALQHA